MRINKKIQAVLSIIASFFLVVFMIGYFIPVSHPRITRRITELMNQAGTDSCVIGSCRLIPFRGIWIKNLYLVSEKNKKISARIHISKAQIRFGVRDAISLMNEFRDNKKQPDNTIRKPAIQPGAAPVHELIQPLFTHKYLSHMSSLSFSDCSLVMTILKQRYRGEEIDLKMNRKKNMFDGVLACKNFTAHHLFSLNNIKTHFIVRPTILEIKKYKSSFCDGDISGACVINSKQHMIENAKLDLSQCDLGTYYSEFGPHKGELQGTVSISLSLGTSILHYDSLQGQGSLTVKKLYASKTPVQKNLAVLLVLPGLSEMNFDRITSDISLKHSRLLTPNLKGSGQLMDFISNGWFSVSGYLYQDLKGTLKPEFMKNTSKLVSRSLKKDKKGNHTFSCKISGSFNNPKLKIDQAIIQRAVNNVFQDIKKGFEGLFK